MLATTLHAILNSDVSKLIYLIPVMTMMLAIPIHATTLWAVKALLLIVTIITHVPMILVTLKLDASLHQESLTKPINAIPMIAM
jgi:positive regulator of sigma E activity